MIRCLATALFLLAPYASAIAATASDDFSGHTATNNLEADSNWTEQDTNTWIVDIVTDASAIGGKKVELDDNVTGNDGARYTFGSLGSISGSVECTLIQSWSTGSPANNTPNLVGIFDVTAAEHYTLVRKSATGEWRFARKGVNSFPEQYGSNTSIYSPVADTLFVTRLRYDDTANELKVKIWEYGSSEPGSWQMTATTVNDLAGPFTPGIYHEESDIAIATVEWIGCSDGGEETAPLPGGGGGQSPVPIILQQH